IRPLHRTISGIDRCVHGRPRRYPGCYHHGARRLNVMKSRLLHILTRVGAIAVAIIVPASIASAAIAVDEDAPWPRVRSTNGNTVTLHLPQVERWTSNSFSARAAVEVKLANAKDGYPGVIWIEAHGSVDASNRMVTLDRFDVVRGRF